MDKHKQSFSDVENSDKIESLATDIFFNLNKEKHEKLIIISNIVFSLEEALNKKDEKSYNVLKEKLNELRDEFFPQYSIESLTELSIKYRSFVLRGFNLAFAKHLSEVNDFGPFSNTFISENERGRVEHKFIKPVPIKSISSDLSKADRMRRRHRSAALQTSDSITVMLTNSFVLTRIRRPTRLEQAELINRIEKELRLYGERWNVAGIKLERGGIAKILVDFFIDLVTYHTVEDIDVKEELTSVILYNDIDAIAMGLLEAGSPKGVYYNLTCLANKCNYSSLRRYEASELYLTLDESFNDEQRAFISQLPVAGRKFKIEEIKAHQNQYQRNGEKIDTAIKLYAEGDSENPYGELNIGIPTLDEYFGTYEFMSQLYNDVFKRHSADYAADPKKLYEKRSELIGSTRMGELLHWVKNYVTYPDSDGDNGFVDDRSDGEQRQFEEGLLYIFSDDDRVYEDALVKMHKTIPFMTHSVTGIIESRCPGCQSLAGEDTETIEPITLMAKESGFTPIDPVTNFFDHTRMMIASLGREQQIEEDNIF